MTDKIYIFAYGTLNKQFLLHKKIVHRCQSEIVTIENNVELKGYQLAINSNYGFPIAFPSPNTSIKGNILEVNSETLREIIDIESGYFIKIIPVEVKNKWYNWK
jgi:gamma-glutamylcyclotransferase (GGCT)/AIG2-like uncharacterized protein YtfP